MLTRVTACALLLAFTLAVPGPVPDQGVSVPLSARDNVIRDADGTVNPAWYFRELEYTLGKYGKVLELPDDGSGVRKRATRYCQALFPLFYRKLKMVFSGKLRLKDQVEQGVDVTYSGPVKIGGDQKFGCIFDTGSADNFVPGKTCNAARGCVGKTKYDEGGFDVSFNSPLRLVS
jgi:hypothetical protein